MISSLLDDLSKAVLEYGKWELDKDRLENYIELFLNKDMKFRYLVKREPKYEIFFKGASCSDAEIELRLEIKFKRLAKSVSIILNVKREDCEIFVLDQTIKERLENFFKCKISDEAFLSFTEKCNELNLKFNSNYCKPISTYVEIDHEKNKAFYVRWFNDDVRGKVACVAEIKKSWIEDFSHEVD